MSIKNEYKVTTIPKQQTHEWLLYKHYAKRLTSIMYSFGLYDKNNDLQGVCTFGMPANYIEMNAWKPFDLLELNRLVINNGLPPNICSYFISQALKQLPNKTVVISYADLDMGHHGYIYQATNWLYTGIGGQGSKIYSMADGSEQHQRSIDRGDKGKYKEFLTEFGGITGVRKAVGKARYYYFIGNKKEKKDMLKLLRFPILPYPKGDNKRYDAGYQPDIQQTFF